MFDDLVFEKFRFTPRAQAIPADRRLIWRCCLMLLVLRAACHGQKASLLKLHVFNWALRSKNTTYDLIKSLKAATGTDSVIVRFDPGLPRVLAFLEATGMIARLGNGKFSLAKKGKLIAEKILSDENVFSFEKNAINEMKTLNVSETCKHRFRSDHFSPVSGCQGTSSINPLITGPAKVSIWN